MDVTVEGDASVGSDPELDLGWAAGTRSGRFVLSVAMALLCITLVIWNLPRSEVRSELRPIVRPAVYALAIDQSWAVFAPNPTTVSLAVEADVYLADGSIDRYRFPHGDDLIGAYREYRWRKWERRIRLDDNSRLWRPTAEWIAEQYDDRVVKVVLVRIFSDTPEPGSGEDRVWETVEFYTLDLDPEDDR